MGVSLVTKLKARLLELWTKLMWPTLEYMAGRGDAVFQEEVGTLQVGMPSASRWLWESLHRLSD